jgi:DNA-binding LytR/AlgR family response regulator
MRALQLLIVEDEVIIANDMKMMLEAVGYQVCGMARNKERALQALALKRPDLVLIDIHLTRAREGIELAGEVRHNHQLPFIFCTSFSDRQTLDEAKQVRPNGYLLKPFTKEDLYVAIEMALLNAAEARQPPPDFILNDSFFVKEGNAYTKVLFKDILFVAQDRNYVDIHTADRVHPVRSSLKDFIGYLPPNQFMQIHRSFLVNLLHITGITGDSVKLPGREIAVSRTFREELLKKVKRLS